MPRYCSEQILVSGRSRRRRAAGSVTRMTQDEKKDEQ